MAHVSFGLGVFPFLTIYVGCYYQIHLWSSKLDLGKCCRMVSFLTIMTSSRSFNFLLLQGSKNEMSLTIHKGGKGAFTVGQWHRMWAWSIFFSVNMLLNRSFKRRGIFLLSCTTYRTKSAKENWKWVLLPNVRRNSLLNKKRNSLLNENASLTCSLTYFIAYRSCVVWQNNLIKPQALEKKSAQFMCHVIGNYLG